jgi:hypothetical protein
LRDGLASEGRHSRWPELTAPLTKRWRSHSS